MQKPNLIKQKNFLPSCISTITSAFANIYLHALGAPVFFYTRARVRVKKHKHSICFIALLVTFLTVFIGLGVNSSRADATTSDYINFQARLENSSGAIVPDGNYNVEFKLYNSASGGSALWTEDYLNSASQGIAVSNGYLTANLGSITAFPNTINWDQQLWLTINIGGTGTNVGPSNTDPSAWDGEMNPRLQLTAIPYAFRAGELAAPGSNPSTLGWVSQTSTNSLLLPNESGTLCVEGDTTNCGFAPISGSSNYIQNTTSVQSGANYNISGNGTIGGNLTVDTIQTASAQPLSITANAASTWSTSAGNLTIQAAGTNTLALDTAGAGTVTIAAANATTVDIGATGTTANATSVNIGTSSTAVQTIAIGSTYSTSTLSLEGGTGSSAISISAGVGANAATAGNGGGIKIAAGNGGNGSTANGNGGNLTLSAGAAGVGTGTTGTAGSVIVDNQSNSTTAFQVQNVSGANILNVDTATTPNLLTDGDFEGDGQGNWLGSNATLSVSNAQAWQGNNSLKVQITAANGYAYYNYSFAENAPYTLSFYGLASGSNISTINIGYTYNGTSTDKCTSQSLNTTNWTRVICSFTTPNTTLTGNANIYIKDTTNSQTFYIDGVQLQTGGSVTPFNPGGGVQLNGVVESPLTLQSLSNSTTAFQVQNAAGTSNLLVADTADNTIGIAGASTTAGYNLNVAGSINASSNITVGGTAVCLVTTCASSSGSGNYIDNAITTQKANFNIQSANASYVGAVIEGASGQSADLLDLENTSGIVASVDKNGNFTTTGSESVGTTLNVTGNTTLSGTLTVSNSASIQDTSATAFQIQNTGGSSSLLTADTTSSDMSIGIDGASTSAGYALNVTGSINASSNVYVNGTAVCTVTLCAASSGSGNYIINGTATQNANFNIQSANASYVGAVIEGASGQSADLLDLENSAGTPIAYVDSSGNLTAASIKSNGNISAQMQSLSGGLSLIAGSSGSLAAGTYYYEVIPVDALGNVVAGSGTAENHVTVGASGSVLVSWSAVQSATSYRVYRGTTSGGENVYYTTTSNSFIDTGAAGTSGSLPTTTTAYVNKIGYSSNSFITGGNLSVGSELASNTLTVSPSSYGTFVTNGFDTTITQTGNTITGYGTTFTSAMSGGTIYYSDGTTASITYVSASSLTSSVSKTISSQSSYTIGYGGFNVTSSGTAFLQPSSSSATAFQILNASGSSLLTADTTSSDMSIGIDGASTSAGYALNVTGSINASSNVYVNGTAVCTVTLCAASSGSGNYIINGTATQNANFNIQSANASYVGAVIEGASGQSADLLDLENGLGNKVFTVSATGSTFIQTTTNSTTAFQVQGSSGSSATLLNADTSNMRVGVDVTYASMTIPTSLTASAATTGSGSLTDGTTYYYVVTAIDSVGGETTPSTPPASATAGSNKIIDLYWNAVSGASAYNIYRCSGSSGCTEEYLTTVLSNYSSSDPYQDTGVITPQSISPPSNNTAYVATNNSNSNLQLTIGGNGTPTGQVYVSGTIPSKSVGSVSTGSNPRGVAISGNYAYVVNSGSSSNSLQVFDISNPDDPLSVGSVTTDSDPYAVAVSGIYAYVVTNSSDAFEIYNISNPASPTLVSGGTVSLAGPGTSVYVQGRYAYVIAGSDMQVIDISNPSSPSIISTTGSPNGGTETQVFVNDGYAYITPDTSGYSENLNISNPYSPTEPDSYGFYYGGSGTGIYAQGSYIYELLSDNLEIFDASNPSNVALLDTLTLSGSPQSIVVEGRYAYVANYYNHTIQVIDVSDPANAVLLPNTMPTSGSVISLAVEGRYAYAVNYNNGSLQVFDLGGEYAQQFQAGGAEVGNLTVTSNSTFGGDVNLQGGLTVGSTTQLDGNLGVSGTANLAGGIQGDTSSNASLGSELMVSTTNFSSNWSGTNWSNTSSGATHSTGSTAADVYSGFTPAANTTYQIVYSFNGASGNGTDNIYAEIGGVSGQTIYAGSDTNETQVITTTGTGSLQFVPSTNWNGTITSVSVKVLTTSNAALQVLNSSGVSSLDVRTSTNTGNTFLGVSSGRSNTTGSYNTTLGYYALQDNTTGSYNTVIGDYALHSNTTGNYNTATGYQALQDNTTGNYNTATGYYALLDNTTGYSNTALGYYSLQDNTIGFYNTGLGVNALQDNTSGEANAALGFNVLQSNTTGVDNAALGVVALQDNTSGYDNTASGYYSLQANTTGYDNVALGYQAGYTSNGSNANSTGSNNTFVGYQAGPGTSTQLQNATAIGTNAVVSENNALVLGCISGTNSCSANTEVGIGTASPIGQLNVQSSSYQTGQVVFSNGLTGTPPTYPNSYLPSLVVQDNETTSSRPLFFGYSTGSAWAAFLDSGSCGSFSQMCLDLGNGSTAYTALENVGTTLRVGGGDDGSFSSVVVGSGSASSSPSLLIVANGNSSTDPTESDGAIYYNSVDESFRCGENGVWRSCLGGLVNSSTGASSAVSATTTKTNFTGGINNQYTMLANDCQPGVVYLIKAQGVYSNSPTASTLTFDLTDGGTSTNLVASGAIPTVASASNAGWELNAQIICDTTGSSGTAEVQGDVMVSSSTAGAGNSTNTGLMANSGTVTLNTTTTNTLAIAVTWGANTPGNTITMRQFIVQRIGP